MELDYQREALELNGQWAVLVEKLEEPQRQAAEVAWVDDAPWGRAEVPGPLVKDGDAEKHRQIRCVWARRVFELSAEQAKRGAVLKWGGVRFGATIYVNGRRVGQRVPLGPYTLLLPAGVLRAGPNTLLLRVPGWGGIPRGEAGYPLFATGSATQSWGGKNPAIYEGVWLEFYDRAYVKRALALADLEGRRVVVRVELTSGEPLPPRVQVEVAVRDVQTNQVVGQAREESATELFPLALPVPMSSVKPWTPQTPHLYEAEVTVSAEGRLCDRLKFRFGMRSIRVVNGHYELNGQPLWLRGSNLVYEWLWGDTFKGKAKAYLVDEARRMNLNCFRTHTLPPPTDWVNVCDQYGTMILAELPVLYNHQDFKFTDTELGTFNAHVLDDAEQWIGKLWNHPAVILWVLTNESPGFNEAFESGEFWQFVKALDPSRPAMRPGPAGRAGTPEVYDMHTCHNFASGVEGAPVRHARKEAGLKDAGKILSNSEYMNIFGQHTERWLGEPEHPGAKLVFAEFAMEHTEAMRRARFDCILPYMFAGWTGLRGERWRDDFPSPMAAALHSSMAPVLASLDLFNRNHVAGSKLSVAVHLINELPHDVAVTLEYYLTPRDPLFVPDDGAMDAALWRKRRQLHLKAQAVDVDEITLPVPVAEGEYFLLAVVRRAGDEPVVSQRVVRSVARAAVTEGLRRARVVVLGGDPLAHWSLRGLGINYAEHWSTGGPQPDLALIWDEGRVEADDRARTADILAWIKRGGRLVVLDQEDWHWPELVDLRLSPQGNYLKGMSSRAFMHAGATSHEALAGLDGETFKRWNGLLGRVADRSMIEPLPAGARALMWMERPDQPVLLSVASGGGEILICQLQLKLRVATDSEHHDPAAERLFVNLLSSAARPHSQTKSVAASSP